MVHQHWLRDGRQSVVGSGTWVNVGSSTNMCARVKRTCRIRLGSLWKISLLAVFIFVTVTHYFKVRISDSAADITDTEPNIENPTRVVKWGGDVERLNSGDNKRPKAAEVGKVVESKHVPKQIKRTNSVSNTARNRDRVHPIGDTGSNMTRYIKTAGRAFVTERPTNHFVGEPRGPKMVILQYTEFYHPLKEGSFSKCKYSNCEWTTDLKRLNHSHAVLFHMWGGVIRKRGMPKRHPLWQRWIFFTKEAPTRYRFNTWSPILGSVFHLDLPHLNGAFNMTMTFMNESDVPFSYGRTIKRSPPGLLKASYAKGKTRQVAWVVSHCNTSSGRENLVAELQKHVGVDIYGRCGPFDCPKDCFQYLGKKYKFYLALENSDCDDYISEKFWYNAFSYDMVPIVLGRRAKYEKWAPPHSYIQWEDYSIKQLADLIKKLDTNDKLYNEYFEWKQKYKIDNMNGWMCDLCEYLHKNRRTVKYYTNIENFWDAYKRCNV